MAQGRLVLSTLNSIILSILNKLQTTFLLMHHNLLFRQSAFLTKNPLNIEGQHHIIDPQNQSKKEIAAGNLQLKFISKLWAQKPDTVHPIKP